MTCSDLIDAKKKVKHAESQRSIVLLIRSKIQYIFISLIDLKAKRLTEVLYKLVKENKMKQLINKLKTIQ